MNTQMFADFLTGTSHGVISVQPRLEPHAPRDRPAARSLPPGVLLVDEIGILLEDVRIAIDLDVGIARKAAERLAALLASSGRPRGGLAPWQKRKVQTYIEVQIEETILVKDLADLVSLSLSHFSRAFKASFGETPRAYITRAKISQARKLMLTTAESLSQIALACGLLDQSHLCRIFRKATGTTPAAWRRNHAVGPQSGIRSANPASGFLDVINTSPDGPADGPEDVRRVCEIRCDRRRAPPGRRTGCGQNIMI